MIKHLKYKQIDKSKYDKCIASATFSTIWAYSWYLDIVADDWECLVWGDYEMVMPIPYMKSKRHLLRKRIIQPTFCQQLGVFSDALLTNQQFDAFIDFFRSLKPILYSFNSSNVDHIERVMASSSFNFNTIERVNYELPLISDYELICSNYSKNLKRNLNKSQKLDISISTGITTDQLISMKSNFKKHRLSGKLINTMSSIVNTCIDLGYGTRYAVSYQGAYIASAFFIHTDNRIVHLISTSSDIGRKYGAIPYLFDRIIASNQVKDIIFDFEGSMIPGVARFFGSFGAQPNKYYTYTNA